MVLLVSLLYIASRTADKLDSAKPARLTLAACVLCIVGTVSFEISSGAIVTAVASSLTACGISLFLIVLGKNLAFYSREDRQIQLCCAFVAGGFITCISAFLNNVGILILEASLSLFSFLHLYTLKPNSSTFIFSNAEKSHESYHFERATLLTTAVTGFIWGVAFFACTWHETSQPIEYLSIGLPLAVGSLAGLYISTDGRLLVEGTLLQAFPTLAFIGVAPIPFVPDSWLTALGAFLFAAFLFDTIVCVSAMAETARFNQISPYWVIGCSLAWYFSGVALGFASFAAAFRTAEPLIRITVVMLALLFIVWCSSYVFQDRYPNEYDVVLPPAEPDGEDNKPALWQRKIESVIEKYGLTARQQEVFRMLVRGRNAAYIADTFVISNSTAKAHIHNIYRKLDIHSQQELIDLVEESDPASVEEK